MDEMLAQEILTGIAATTKARDWKEFSLADRSNALAM